MMMDYVENNLKQKTAEIVAYCATKMSPSGGTLLSMMTIAEKGEFKALMNPFLLNTTTTTPRQGEKDIRSVSYNNNLAIHTRPFIMAGVNTRVVRRSLELLDRGVVVYNECAVEPTGYFPAMIKTFFEMFFTFLAIFAPFRYFLSFLIPKPGDGPTKEQRRKYWFRHLFVATTTTGEKVYGQVSGGDPGYEETAKMLSEAAICMVNNNNNNNKKVCGVVTAGAAMGMVLVERLRRAGLVFAVGLSQDEARRTIRRAKL